MLCCGKIEIMTFHFYYCVHSGKDADVETILQFAARLESTFELKQ